MTTAPEASHRSISPVILGLYGADFHKLAINTIAFIIGNPSGVVWLTRSSDIALAGLVLAFCVRHFLRRSWHRTHNELPAMLQLFLAIVITCALLRFYDDFSAYQYLRYIGGNLGLFFGALVICKEEAEIRLACRAWVAATILISLIGVWFLVSGINWHSSRGNLIPATSIRMGYQAGIALIYLLLSNDSVFRSWRSALVALFVIGLFASGSKAAILLVICLGVFVLVMSTLVRRVTGAKRQAGVLIILVLASVLMGYYITGSSDSGMLKDTFNVEAYGASRQDRLMIREHFFRRGMEQPLFGNGLHAAYEDYGEDDVFRTHSVSVALFVQTGLLGVLTYVVFLGWVLADGLKALSYARRRSLEHGLLMAILAGFVFMAMKAEISGDVPSNRDLWMFSGLLMNCAVLTMRSAHGRVPSRYNRKSCLME